MNAAAPHSPALATAHDLIVRDGFAEPLSTRGAVKTCVLDNLSCFIFGHAFVYVPNHELLESAIGNCETQQDTQLVPVMRKQMAYGTAITLGDRSLVALRIALEGAMHALPVVQLACFHLCLSRLVWSTHLGSHLAGVCRNGDYRT